MADRYYGRGAGRVAIGTGGSAGVDQREISHRRHGRTAVVGRVRERGGTKRYSAASPRARDSFWESPQGGSSIQTDCISGNTAGVHNWSATCSNHEDQVHDATGDHARVHYYPNGYGAYACMNPHTYWLYLSTTHYDFSYPGEGYQPWGATAGEYQLIYDNAASEALANSRA